MSNRDRPRLLSFTIDDWPVLGGPVSVELTDGVALLVGRNGSGKSAILEGFTAIADIATNRFAHIRERYENFPKTLVADILTLDHRRLRYEYHLLTISIEKGDSLDWDNDEDNREQFSWNDSCQYLDQEEALLWKTESGETTLYQHSKSSTAVLGVINLFNRAFSPNRKRRMGLPVEMDWVYLALSGCQILNNQEIRRYLMRREPFLQKARPPHLSRFRKFRFRNLVETTANKIVRLDENDFEELTAIITRIGIADQIAVKKFIAATSGMDKAREDEQIVEVLIDDTNIGLLSDGSLRVLSILVDLIRPSSISTTIIEEPEQQIHPGLLSKLLREIQVYTLDDNLIISTHSPQVVAEMKPEQIHLVERVDGRTMVRKLDGSEIDNVHAYLAEEGDLGEWVYSGILDDE